MMKFNDTVDSIANRLKYAMSVRGINQAELIKRTGISSGSLSQYTNGYVSPKQNRIYMLAKALAVDEAWLMGYDVPMDKTYKTEEQSKQEIDSDAYYIMQMYSELSVRNKMIVKNLIENLVD